MRNNNIFPTQVFTESMSEPAIKLEGQKVIFDKKVSLLPVDIKMEDEPVKHKVVNGKSKR